MTGSSSRAHSLSRRMEGFSTAVSAWTGTTKAFLLALGAVVVWALTGPLFHYSDTWQLVINTATTVITFLMVFLIQRAQNKAAFAMTLKLNELLAAVEGASNRLIDADDMTEEELEILHDHFRELARMAKRDLVLTKSHSIEEARSRHELKKQRTVGHAGPRRPHRRARRDRPPREVA
jgi:low affinity Fe/Cu permease